MKGVSSSRWEVFHASELELLFGPLPSPVEDDFANQMLDFYINFVNDMDPGGKSNLPLEDLSI